MALAAVALGVATMTGVEALSTQAQLVLRGDVRQWLAADFVVELAEPLSEEQQAALDDRIREGIRTTVVLETTANAWSRQAPDAASVSVKAVSPGLYPFYGAVKLDPPISLQQALEGDAVVAMPEVLERLGLRRGETLRAIPENLIESELFGHEKGAFTGAIKQSKGKIELADQGTLFLDEVGDIPAGAQVKLLRFLQERVIERVGGRQQIAVDVRVVCATNQNLEELIKEGRFREDLYYRLSELVIKVPPLRERNGDAELLAHSFLQSYNEEQRRSVRGFTSEALAAIAKYDWPGNVRELENRVKRAVIMAESQRVTPADLDLVPPNEVPEVLNLAQAREEAERREIPRALSRAEGNISQAAKLLGVSRPTLYDLMRQHNIKL